MPKPIPAKRVAPCTNRFSLKKHRKSVPKVFIAMLTDTASPIPQNNSCEPIPKTNPKSRIAKGKLNRAKGIYDKKVSYPAG